jgi:hypothetical protein
MTLASPLHSSSFSSVNLPYPTQQVTILRIEIPPSRLKSLESDADFRGFETREMKSMTEEREFGRGEGSLEVLVLRDGGEGREVLSEVELNG